MHYSYLEVDDHSEGNESGHKVHEVRQVLSIERLAECADLVVACRQEMEECDDSAFELSACVQKNFSSNKLSTALPRPVLTVAGLNAFHTIVSQMFVAMNSEIPLPRP